MTKSYKFTEETAQILALSMAGLTRIEITQRLNMAFDDVQTHIDSIFDILGTDLIIPDTANDEPSLFALEN